MQLPFLLLSILNFITAGHYFLSEIDQDNLKETIGFFSFPHLFLASEYNFLRRLIFSLFWSVSFPYLPVTPPCVIPQKATTAFTPLPAEQDMQTLFLCW